MLAYSLSSGHSFSAAQFNAISHNCAAVFVFFYFLTTHLPSGSSLIGATVHDLFDVFSVVASRVVAAYVWLWCCYRLCYVVGVHASFLFICVVCLVFSCWGFFFFNVAATSDIYTLYLHYALPRLPPRR